MRLTATVYVVLWFSFYALSGTVMYYLGSPLWPAVILAFLLTALVWIYNTNRKL